MADPQVVDVFKIVPDLASQNAEVVKRAKDADSTLQNFMTEFDTQTAPAREQLLKEAVDAKTSVNDKLNQDTKNFTQTLTPLFAKKQAIADRQVELQEMNPFQRWFKGMVSRDYNQGDLGKLDAAVSGDIQAHSQAFQTNVNTADQLMKGIDENYSARDSVIRLHNDNEAQDVQFKTQLLGSSQQVFASQIAGVTAQTEVIRGQELTRQNALDQMTPDDVNKALSQAKGNAGRAIVNGIPLSQGELFAKQQQQKDAQMALESRALALQNGRLELAEHQQHILISKMGGAEIQTALQNGGVYKGQKLDMIALTQAFEASQRRNELLANQAVTTSGMAGAASTLKMVGQQQLNIENRAVGIFGQIPQEVNLQSNRLTAKITAYTAGLNEANKTGTAAEYVAKQAPAIQQMIEEQAALKTGLVNRWAGGNKKLAALGQSWMDGTPLNGEAAVDGLIELARGGLPAGTKLSGPALEMYNAAKLRVAAFDKQGGGAGMTPDQLLAGKPDKAKQAIDLRNAITGDLQKLYNQNTMNRVLESSPTIAASIKGPDGKPIGFSRVKSEDFKAAMTVGNNAGVEFLSHKLNMKPDDVKKFLSQGPGGPEAQRRATGDKSFSYGDLVKTMQSVQQQAMMVALDASGSATPTFKPSQAYVQMLNHPEFQQKALGAVGQSAQGNIVEFGLNSVSSNSFDSTMYNYAKNSADAYAHMTAKSLQEAAKNAPTTLTEPRKFAMATMGAIDGLSPSDKAALAEEIKKITYTNPFSYEDTSQNRGSDAAVDHMILNTKFQNPELEAIRRRAAAGWMAARKTTKNSLQSLIDHGQ